MVPGGGGGPPAAPLLMPGVVMVIYDGKDGETVNGGGEARRDGSE